jgi:hypothetical protein
MMKVKERNKKTFRHGKGDTRREQETKYRKKK